MKIWKLVSGILSCVLVVLVSFQSCAAGLANSLENSAEMSGFAGILVSILMLSGGIVSIVIHKSNSRGGNIALVVLFGMAALIGYTMHGSFSDLAIWATWCLINAILALICLRNVKKAG